MYIQKQETFRQINVEQCFFVPIYHTNETISQPSVKHLNFVSNSAQYAGDVLYGGSIDTCTLLSNDNTQFTGPSFDTLSHFVGQAGNSVIASSPKIVCLCDKNEPKCENRSISIGRLLPGSAFTLSLVATGQRFGIVPSELHATILNENQTNTHFLEQGIQQLESSCTNVTFTLYSSNAIEIIAISVGKKKLNSSMPLLIEVTLSPCPMGFVLSDESPTCKCAPALLEHQLVCDVVNWTIQRNERMWIGSCEGNISGILLHEHCAFDYCKNTQMWIDVSSPDQQCAFNRTGILCGKCKEGLSLVLGSSKCLQCSNNYLLLVLVFALAGILLVFVIKICNLTVSIGGISCLIFYANIIQINRPIFLSEDMNVLTIFIAWLNLDFGIVTCFYNGMDAIAKSAIQFVFPFFLCSIALTVIIGSHYSIRITKLFQRNAVSVIATLVLLADAKLLRNAITILSIATIKYPDSSTRTLWLYDGNIDYWDIKHIALIVVACLILTVHFILLCLLLFNSCLQRISHLKCLSWIWKLKPFFDAYTAPQKDRYSFWTGLLVLFRSISFLFSLFSPAFSLSAIVLGACCLLMLGWWFAGVNKHTALNILESFILLNLVFVSVCTVYAQSSGSQWIRIAAVYTSVGTMFIVFLIITFYPLHPWIRRILFFRRRQYRQSRHSVYQSTVSLSTDYYEFEHSNPLVQSLMLTLDTDGEAILLTEEESNERDKRVIMNNEGMPTLTVEDHDSHSRTLPLTPSNSDGSTLIEDQHSQATSSTQKVTEETIVEFTHERIPQPTLYEDSGESDLDGSIDVEKQSDCEGEEINQDKRLTLLKTETTQSKERIKPWIPSLIAANHYGSLLNIHESSTPLIYNTDEADILSKNHEQGLTGSLEIQHSILQQHSGRITLLCGSYNSTLLCYFFLPQQLHQLNQLTQV